MATIEIDGKTLEVKNGKMIIEVADEAGIYIPRFCYHRKLSVAANCRMCLVEVENGRKPVPACATPITDGMKVYTKSKEALRSQEAVMEFLLINHPLDCPICDQGGECELQDVSMGFGYDDSEYEEQKRAVKDDNLGHLIETEMTRCIHCTRCVRFGEEIAGLRELGAVGRGEDMQISTYVKHSMVSEISGNIIDLCPVGALTSKPYRYTARPWELEQFDGVAPHDCWGSNIHLHMRRNELMRVVPKEKEAINETWLSDRDRFSYLGLNSKARANQPLIKRDGQWEAVDWPTALKFTAEGISRIIKHHGPEQFAAFASPSSTLEELYTLQKLMRGLNINNLDYRLHQTDFRDQNNLSIMPVGSLKFSELEHQQTILLLACNIHREVPLAGVRTRKAFRNGAKLFSMSAVDYDYHFDISEKIIVPLHDLPLQLAKLVLAMVPDVKQLPRPAQRLLLGLEVDEPTLTIARALTQPNAVIVTGELFENHPEAALLRTLLGLLKDWTEVKDLKLTTGANSVGAAFSGMLPHRTAGGKTSEIIGLDVQAALASKLKGYFLLGVEPGFDFENPYRARQAMIGAEFVVLLSAFNDESMQDYADVLLPIAPFAETSGTYINAEQTWQTVKGVKKPYGDSRPAWKIIRVLANLLAINGFDYLSSEDILKEIKSLPTHLSYTTEFYYPEALPLVTEDIVRMGEWPLYRCDMIVRHAEDLQFCASADIACIRLHPNTAEQLALNEMATISQGNIEITLPLKRDDKIAPGVVWVANALPETIDLGSSFSAVTIKRSE